MGRHNCLRHSRYRGKGVARCVSSLGRGNTGGGAVGEKGEPRQGNRAVGGSQVRGQSRKERQRETTRGAPPHIWNPLGWARLQPQVGDTLELRLRSMT